MNNYYNELELQLKKAAAFHAAMNLFDYDMQVTAPSESDKYSSKLVGILADEYRKIFVDDNTGMLIKKCICMNKKGYLTPMQKAILNEACKKRLELLPLSGEDYRNFTETTSSAVNIWSRAKEGNDFDSYAPTLQKIIDYKIKFAKSRAKKGQKPYDVLLNDFVPDFDTEVLDATFEQIKSVIIPLIKRVVSSQTDNKVTFDMFSTNSSDKEKLTDFCNYISEYIGFDPERGVRSESSHPFTINIHNHDVRITNNYSEGNIIDPIFSVIHETGHALYELGISDSLTLTILGEGTSMGMHESISRFYENIIGRSASFWKPLYPKLVDTFPDILSDVSIDEFITAINTVMPGQVRIQADELTYPLHIIIRYELEKELISGKLKAKDLPKEWNQRYKEYLGITPDNDSKGVLQDIHWSMGEFGYFPSYLIGSAISAQIYDHLKDNMPFDEYLETGNIASINNYLTENIFRYGKAVKTNTILKHVTGEEFNVTHYLEYLQNKWHK